MKMRLTLAAFLGVSCLGLPEGAAAQAAAERAIAFVDVSVVPMDSERVLEHQTLVVAGGRIHDLGPSKTLRVPKDALRVPGQGRWLVPGFTDAHVHLYSRTELPLYLANGVTTVYNLHGQPAHVLWRREVEAGRLAGPRIFTTGPVLARRLTPEEARRLVAEQAEAGYDGIKIYNAVGREEYPVLAAEARARHLLFTGHVARAPGYDLTLQSGQSIAHAEEIVYTFFNPQRDDDLEHVVLDAGRIPEAARLAAAAGISVTPTLSMFRDIIRQAEDVASYLKSPELGYLAPWVRAGLEPGANRYVNRYSPELLARLRSYLPFQRQITKALQDAGASLLAGTDATNIGPVAGFSIHEELAELVGSGLTPFQALQAATTSPARHFARPGEDGTLAPGRRADLVLLEANPLADIAATRRVAGVMAAGRWLDAAELGRMREAIPPAFARELDFAVREMEWDPVALDGYLAEHDPLGGLANEVARRVVAERGAAALLARLRQLRAARPGSSLASEETLNMLGYGLLGVRPADAVAVFKGVTQDFPRSSNAFDSLGEALAKTGDTAGAVAAYASALEIDPAYPNAAAARAFLAEHAAPR